MDLFRFIPGYTSAIYDTGREPAFVLLLTFVGTYLLARGYTRIARRTGWGSANIGGVHTHHMVFGLVASFISSALMFALLPPEGPILLLLAAVFGGGAALVLDEFALMFHLRDVYWEKEGRKSVDAVIVGMLLGGMFLLQAVPLGINSSDPAWILVGTIIVNLSFALVAAYKGKFFMTIFGLFIPSLAQIGAIRLAEPDSAWAREFYARNPKKLERSKKRYERYNKTWRVRKERLWDIIGGEANRPLLVNSKLIPKKDSRK
jgi:hypothetical protein